MKINTVRGAKDLFGKELHYHNTVIDTAKRHADLYCYDEFHTPIFEYSEVFHRNLGESSDIVSKETYTFSDRDKRTITLRPEFTAGLARAIFSNGLQQKLPQKLFSYGPIFRHERPQKCRQRQFHQINYEFIGADNVHHDVEVILMAKQFLSTLGLEENYVIELNSLGCSQSRTAYREALVEYFSKHKSDLSEDSLMRLEKNPLRILDTKDEDEKKLVLSAPKMDDYFTDSSRKRWEELKSILEELQIDYIENPKLVRGLDYYTHTVFEFITHDLGAQGTILAGGRYDALYSNLANVDIPAIGFAGGVERIAQIMMDKKLLNYHPVRCAILPLDDTIIMYTYEVANLLREGKINCYTDYNGKISKRLRKADQNNVEYAIILGDNELSERKINIKNLKTGAEELVDFDRALDWF